MLQLYDLPSLRMGPAAVNMGDPKPWKVSEPLSRVFVDKQPLSPSPPTLSTPEPSDL